MKGGEEVPRLRKYSYVVFLNAIAFLRLIMSVCLSVRAEKQHEGWRGGSETQKI